MAKCQRMSQFGPWPQPTHRVVSRESGIGSAPDHRPPTTDHRPPNSQPTMSASSPIPAAEPGSLDERAARTRGLESRNVLLLAGYQVMLRLAWVFKTESVVMPAFLHAISGQAWMQGWLPMLNRFGQSLPPLIYAEHLRAMPRKKVSLLRTTALMGGLFLILAFAIWLAPRRETWWPALFLTVYALFFIAVGLNTLAYNTLQGKLIRASRRGRVMSHGGVFGSIVAVAAAWLVLADWEGDRLSAFILPFSVTGFGMLIAASLAWVIAEPRDLLHTASAGRASLTAQLVESAGVFRNDAHFQRLAICAMAFVTSQFLMPHYVPLAIERLPSSTTSLVLFLVVQNIGVGLFSVLLGAVADRRGNRLALRIALLTCALTPILAIALADGLLPGGGQFYWLTFFAMGMQPVTFRTLTNYTLELTVPEWHPRYLSTIKICLAVPFLFSLPIGLLIGFVGYESVFLVIAAIIGGACLLTWTLAEPRRWPISARTPPLIEEG